MECEEIHRLLNAYLDGELDQERQLEVERHLILCASCESLTQERQEFQAFFKISASRYKAPLQLKAKILAATRREEVKQRFAFLRESWVYAATVIALGLLALNILFPDTQKEFSRQAVLRHSQSLSADHLVQVASSKPEVVKPWLTAKLNFPPPVVDSPAGYSLLGGRVDQVRSRSVAALVYQHGNDVVSLFCWPPEKERLLERDHLIEGYRVSTWSNAQCNYILVSKLSDHQMNEFVDSFRVHIQSGAYF
jgi:anti-sigma factor RsiW